MLEFLELVDFQCHKERRIDFDPCITCIVGDTDAGKSAILRAIRFVARNNPTTGIARWGTRGCAVRLGVDGKIVIREKTKTLNRYALNEQEFASFGTEVPRDIQNVLKISDINFGGQHEAPFWFDLSAPEVSRQLNSVIDLSFMDDVLSKAAGEVRSARTNVDLCRGRLEEARNQKEMLAWVLDLDEQLSRLECQNDRLVEISSRRASLESLVSEVREAEKHILKATAIEYATAKAISMGEQLLEVAHRREDLNKLIEEVKSARKIADRSIPDLGDLEILQEKYEEKVQFRRRLEALIEEIRSWRSVVDIAEKVIEETNKDLEGQTCPLCGNRIKIRS